MTTPCEVCYFDGGKRLRSGNFVCDSCRRFYLRNLPQRNSLVCVTGDGKCIKRLQDRYVNGIDFHDVQVKANRSMCRFCRLKRCLALRVSNESRSEECDRFVISTQTSNDHRETRRLIFTATKIFLEKQRSNILRDDRTPLTTCRPVHFIRDNTTRSIMIMTEFFKSIPGHEDFDLQDRCLLFSAGYSAGSIAENCYQSSGRPMVMNMNNKQFSNKVLPYAPFLQDCETENASFHKFLNNLELSLEEFSFLLCLLFFGPQCRKFMKKPAAFDKWQWEIRNALITHLFEIYGNNVVMINSRLQVIENVLKPLHVLAAIRTQAVWYAVAEYEETFAVTPLPEIIKIRSNYNLK